MDDEFLIP